MFTYKRFQLIFEDCSSLDCNLREELELLWELNISLLVHLQCRIRTIRDLTPLAEHQRLSAWVLKLIRHNEPETIFLGDTTQVFVQSVKKTIFLDFTKCLAHTKVYGGTVLLFFKVPDAQRTCSVVACLLLNLNWSFGMNIEFICYFRQPLVKNVFKDLRKYLQKWDELIGFG